MEIYNTKYVCGYNNSDIFLESELKILTNDEKNFVRDALYRRDLYNIFKIEDCEFDDIIIELYINKIFSVIKNNIELRKCISKLGQQLFSSDLKVGLMLLFSFDYLYLAHPCICEFIETGNLTNTSNSLIELRKKIS